MPQPPPPKVGAGDEDEALPEPAPQVKEDIIFLTSLDAHLGHSVLFSAGYKLCKIEKFSLHFKHIYS